MTTEPNSVRMVDLAPTLAYTPPASAGRSPKPAVGLVMDSAPSFATETERLLRSRLRSLAIYLTAATVIFGILNMMSGGSAWLPMLALQTGMLLSFCGMAVLLSSRVHLSLRQLRFIEVAIFGLTGLCLLIGSGIKVRDSAEAGKMSNIAAGLLIWITTWFGMMNLYLVLIPSRLRRLTVMMVTMGLMPVAEILLYRHQYQAVRELVTPQTLGIVVGMVTIGIGGTIFLGHAVGVLRRQAFTGQLFGQYRLKQLLGSGGMGEVRLAEHVLLKRPCAIKVIHPNRTNDPDALTRFEREVRAAAELTHPNTIAIYDYGRAEDGSFYYVMEYLPGLTLAELVDRHGPLPAERVIYLLRQVCGALAEAHARGLIHRDVKPGNIIVTERGGVFDFVKLLDFGLVKPAAGNAARQLTQENVIAGSPLFMSPEQSIAGRELDPRSDLYSLGAVAYFLLTGRPPFSGESAMEVIVAHARDAVTPPSQINNTVPKDLEAVVLRCLAKDREGRFPTARELDGALADCDSSDYWNREAAEHWWKEHPEAILAER